MEEGRDYLVSITCQKFLSTLQISSYLIIKVAQMQMMQGHILQMRKLKFVEIPYITPGYTEQNLSSICNIMPGGSAFSGHSLIQMKEHRVAKSDKWWQGNWALVRGHSLCWVSCVMLCLVFLPCDATECRAKRESLVIEKEPGYCSVVAFSVRGVRKVQNIKEKRPHWERRTIKGALLGISFREFQRLALYHSHLPPTLLLSRHGDLYIAFNIVDFPGMGMRGGQDVVFISSCRREFPVALKKENQNKTYWFIWRYSSKWAGTV